MLWKEGKRERERERDTERAGEREREKDRGRESEKQENMINKERKRAQVHVFPGHDCRIDRRGTSRV